MNKNDIKELGKTIITLQKEAVNQILLFWKPKVEQIISNKSQDVSKSHWRNKKG